MKEDFTPLLSTTASDLKFLKAINDDYLSKHSDAESVFAGAKIRHLLDPSKASNEAIVKDFVKVLGRNETTLAQAVDGLESLRWWSADTEEYVKVAHKRWSEASAFQQAAS